MADLVAYYRVSTLRQHRSGLGIEAQRAAVTAFASAHGYTIAAEHIEVETGKGADALERRPQLVAALATARLSRCKVIVGKLVRIIARPRLCGRTDGPEWPSLASMPTCSCCTSMRRWRRRNDG
jgi:DNA invertase Pin-like site-specific DNA recombinase